MRTRLAWIPLACTVALSGCYLYRDPITTAPVVTAANLPRSAAIEDLDSLVTIVTEVHPNPSPRFRPLRDSLAHAWPDTISRARLARDLNRLLTVLGDGHTGLSLDRLEEEAALANGGRSWSFAVRRTMDGIIIGRVVGSDTTVLRSGDRLEAINGIPIDSLVEAIGRAVPAELPAYRDAVVLRFLGSSLWMEGIRPPAEVRVTGIDGASRVVRASGATRQELQAASSPQGQVEPLSVIGVRDSVLLLDFRRMWGSPERAAFTARLDSAFEAAARTGVRAVVVDLRRNGGGDSRWGTQLLSYVTGDSLSQGVRKEWKGSRRYRMFFKSRVSPLLRYAIPFSWFDAPIGGLFSGPDGTMAVIPFTPSLPTANPRRLERPLCLLIGPGTFSSAMMLANTARRSGVATLIGEPTGEPPNFGGEVMSFHLRRSGLSGQVSSASFVLDEDPAGNRRGVLPHITVVPTREDIRAGRDPVMERAMACGRAPRPSFPEAWAGRWEGMLTTTSPPDSVRNRIPISLVIAREDTGAAWTWRTVFNADTVRGLRPYRLLPRDVARGWFATDEGNGVELEETWVDGALISVFQVGERVLESRYTVRNDTLVHDIIWWSATPVRRMRSDGPNGERGAEILSHRVEGRQRAVMVRMTSPTGYR